MDWLSSATNAEVAFFVNGMQFGGCMYGAYALEILSLQCQQTML